MLGLIYALLFYAATLLLVVGVAAKIRKYARTPAPLKIPTTPAPKTGSPNSPGPGARAFL